MAYLALCCGSTLTSSRFGMRFSLGLVTDSKAYAEDACGFFGRFTSAGVADAAFLLVWLKILDASAASLSLSRRLLCRTMHCKAEKHPHELLQAGKESVLLPADQALDSGMPMLVSISSLYN